MVIFGENGSMRKKDTNQGIKSVPFRKSNLKIDYCFVFFLFGT